MTQPGYGSGPSPSADASARRSILGVVSLAVGVAISVLGLVSRLVDAVILSSGEFDLLRVSGAVVSVLTGVLALAALGLGIAGLLRRGAPRAAAAAGTALGAAALIGLLGSLLYTLSFSLLGD